MNNGVTNNPFLKTVYVTRLIEVTGNMNEALEKVNYSFMEWNKLSRKLIMKSFYLDEVDDWPIISDKIEYGTTNLDELF